MDAATELAMEKARAEKKSPVILWLVNLLWPGLGNIVVGQVGTGIAFGLLQWACIGVTALTLGFGGILCAVNWAVASGVGHSSINRRYAAAIAGIQPYPRPSGSRAEKEATPFQNHPQTKASCDEPRRPAMRRIVFLSCLATLGVLFLSPGAFAYRKVKCFMPQAPELTLDGVRRVAILDFKGKSEADQDFGKFLADQMIKHFLMENRGITKIEGGIFSGDKEGVTFIQGVGTKVYSMVERSRLEAVLAEQSISDLGLVSGADAAKVGQLLDVQLIISGDAGWSGTDETAKEVHETYQNKQKPRRPPKLPHLWPPQTPPPELT